MLFLTSSRLSANGTTSSAPECRMVVPGLTVVTVPNRFQAGHIRTRGCRTTVYIHCHGPASAGADDDIGPMPVELGLGNADGGIEIVVGRGRVQDFVAVILEIGRLDAARGGLPAVEEKDFHGSAYP